MNINNTGFGRRPWLDRSLLLLAGSIALSGCASFSKDGGLDGVKSLAQQHIKQEVAWPKTEAEQKIIAASVEELLQKELDAESAVQLAL